MASLNLCPPEEGVTTQPSALPFLSGIAPTHTSRRLYGILIPQHRLVVEGTQDSSLDPLFVMSVRHAAHTADEAASTSVAGASSSAPSLSNALPESGPLQHAARQMQKQERVTRLQSQLRRTNSELDELSRVEKALSGLVEETSREGTEEHDAEQGSKARQENIILVSSHSCHTVCE